ncbi:pyrimidine-nucleoside phosphorylase [Ereboglobus sp. PH5-5]|uniref:thymidine phosphorylase n=1 Tax=Ereboglobus sp. PH5-5 TaxID=2940529 RepID=UPI002406370F|nr:thymidine phosphorylase [Ereboglobus sp. PH5-5]MDF9831930.1 pyrimidine-nucleoside phosphorylase [Ereboglobus sp. PH5-5]
MSAVPKFPLLFPQHVIAAKRDARKLTRDEIDAFVRGATDGSWADYQLSAMLMAICIRGMDTDETAALTEAMMNSGTVADLPGVRLPKVDKHSTGGVGDKVSIHLAPMVAACGVAVPMMSGRGLGHTGGTLDKLESIPGFRVGLTLPEYRAQMETLGVALIGQTAELAPADKKLYALRDVTGTVESIPLITGSILSKKLAEGIDALVLDVKFGAGAFMREKARARELATTMVAACRHLGKPARAILTAMNQPLGRAVGNALEIAECVDCLRGKGPADLMEVTYALGEQMLLLAGVAKTMGEARAKLENAIASGAALEKLRALIVAQNGDPRVVDDPAGHLPSAKHQEAVVASSGAAGGYVAGVDAMGVALAALRLGAGRVRAEDKIDHAAGISKLVKAGARVAAGDTLAVIHANNEDALAEAREGVARAITFSQAPVAVEALVTEII